MSSFKDCRPTISRSPSLACPKRGQDSSHHVKTLGLQTPPRVLSPFRTAQRKERESNPQGSSLSRFRDGRHRPLACPSV